MNEIWFCYTMLFILMCLFSASMSLSAYFVFLRPAILGGRVQGKGGAVGGDIA